MILTILKSYRGEISSRHQYTTDNQYEDNFIWTDIFSIKGCNIGRPSPGITIDCPFHDNGVQIKAPQARLNRPRFTRTEVVIRPNLFERI